MFIQGDQKSVCAPDDYNTEKLQVMFKVSPASLQKLIDAPNYVLEDRVQYSTVHIPNVFCLKYCIFACFLYCNRQAHRDFLITMYIEFKGLLTVHRGMSV